MSAVTSIVRVPAIGSASNKPVKLLVHLRGQNKVEKDEQSSPALTLGFRQLFQRREFCDVSLTCVGQEFHAHKCVLAARSGEFCRLLKETSQLQMDADTNNPEAVRWMLDYIYEAGDTGPSDPQDNYSPTSQLVNADVLRLARRYELRDLEGRTVVFMTRDLTTHNVVQRLSWCDEFGLTEFRQKILQQLTANRFALQEVTSSPAIDQYPALMREMLALIAVAGGGGSSSATGGAAAAQQSKKRVKEEPSAKKKARKN